MSLYPSRLLEAPSDVKPNANPRSYRGTELSSNGMNSPFSCFVFWLSIQKNCRQSNTSIKASNIKQEISVSQWAYRPNINR